MVRVIGKGSKERLVPLGEEALRLAGPLPGGRRARVLLGEQMSDALFVTARGEAHDAPDVLAPDQELRLQAGI